LTIRKKKPSRPPHTFAGKKIWKNDETIPLRAYGPLQEGKNIT